MVTEISHRHGGNLLRFSAWLPAVLIGGLLLTETAAAQPFVVLPVNTNLKKQSNDINSMLMEGRFANPAQQTLFDQFYQDFSLPRWTTPEGMTNIPQFRHDLGNQLRKHRAGAPPAVHDHLNTLLLEFMQKLVAGHFHPAVQVNAMLLIGDLNRVEQPPTPMPEALEVLIAAVQNNKFSDAVRTIAMVGIARHVAVPGGIADEEARKTLTAAMLHVAADDLPAGSARGGREWILGQALDILGRLGAVGENNAVFTLLTKTLADDKLSLYTRTRAAEALGRLNYAGASGINPVATAALLGQFAIDACREELQRAKKTSDPVSNRLVKQRLGAVLLALGGGEDANRKGIMPLASEPNQQAFLDELQKSITPLTDLLDDKKHAEDDLATPVGELQTKLEAWLKKKG